MGKIQVSAGSSFEVTTLDRSFGGKETVVFKVSGGDSANPVTGAAASKLGDVTLNGSPAMSLATMATKQLVFSAAGLGAPGAVTVTGAVIGDKVVAAVNLNSTRAGVVSGSFEGTVSANGAVQQTATTGITASDVILFIIAHQA